MEFEVRAYTQRKQKLAEDEEETTIQAGPYVADIGDKMSEPFGFKVSHISSQTTKKMS